jgi:catechol 2,3-dioxygenase-like lactoylglutathione lyase family enzyme
MLIKSGNATVFVTDLDRAVDFYTNALGLRLGFRAGNHWAQIETEGLVIGLHPVEGGWGPAPGTAGSVQIGLQVDAPLDAVVNELESRGVVFDGPIVDDDPMRLAFFRDPDGNSLYLAEYRRGASG